MGRHSPFDIALDGSERARLERRARKSTTPYRDVIRARIILLAAEGLSNTEIAAKLGISRTTVVTWRGRYANRAEKSKSGRESLEDLPRPGQPPKYT